MSHPRQLGAGGFGKVYLIQHKNNRRKYAAKYQKLNSSKMQKLVGSIDFFSDYFLGQNIFYHCFSEQESKTSP